jgi:transposase
MPTPPDSLPDDASALKALLVAAQAENERLIAIIKELQRYRFGPRSEKIDPDQLALMLEDVEQAIAASAAQAESQTEDQPAKTPVQRKRQINRGAPAATAFASKSARMSRNGSTWSRRASR